MAPQMIASLINVSIEVSLSSRKEMARDPPIR
jgi:hypothetical protein